MRAALCALSAASCRNPAESAADAALNTQIEAACRQACQAIAPAWPLDRSIAVNPHWSRIGLPVRSTPYLTGFLNGTRYWGRPVDVLQLKDGSVLISDDLNGAIYKVSRSR